MKKTYYVSINCVDGDKTVLLGGSTVELPNQTVSQQLLDTLLAAGAVVLMAPPPGKAVEVEPQTTPSIPNKGS
jgi:hypothetical protein